MRELEHLSMQMLLEGCQIYEEIGRSPLGVVYRASHPAYGDCALKYFSKEVRDNREFISPYLENILKIQRLEHPNIAKIFAVDNSKYPFFIRELVLGENLQDNTKKKRLSFKDATNVILDVARAIWGGYPFGVVFKNLKPHNIIISPNGISKVVDVSLPPNDENYLSPEHWKNEKSQTASDIYTLGLIYYEILTGGKLFSGNKEELVQQHLHSIKTILPQENIPVPAAKILNKMLQKDPQKRYLSPAPLIANLREAIVFADTISRPFSLQSSRLNETTENEQQTPERGSTSMFAVMEKSKGPHTDKLGRIATKKITSTEGFEVQGKTEEELEEVYLTPLALQKNLEKALELTTYIEPVRDRQKPLPIRRVYFPKQFEKNVIEHLQKNFRRECWLLKESENIGELEIDIQLEEAYILKHYYHYEDLLQKALQENQEQQQAIKEKQQQELQERGSQQTVDISEEEWQAESLKQENLDDSSFIEDIDSEESHEILQETINDINISTIWESLDSKKKLTKRYFAQNYRNKTLKIHVDFSNAYETMGWVKFVRQHELKKSVQFELIEGKDDTEAKKIFSIFLDKLEEYQQAQEHIQRIKEFFEGDYDISELDRGGMGAVLKLTARNNPTILSLRPENYWARHRYQDYLKIRQDIHGNEIIYAEIPQSTEFVVKVAFDGYEESLIQEARILNNLAQDPNICHTIIGSVQQGRLFSSGEQDHKKIGFYLMLEYAHQGNTEQLFRRFPKRQLVPSVAFAMMYGLVQTLQLLKHKGIIHRDIKPKNILLDNNGIPKLSDFGLAITTTQGSEKLTEERMRLLRVLDEEFLKISREREQAQKFLEKLQKRSCVTDVKKQIDDLINKIPELRKKELARAEELKGRYRPISAEENANMRRFAGSVYYAAPEQFNIEAVLTTACDVYQLGAVMFTMLTGRRPVSGKNSVDIMSQILYPVKPAVCDFVEAKPIVKRLSDLIEKMMAHKPEERLDIEDIRQEMDMILEEHAEELRELPVYQDEDEPLEKVKRKNEMIQKFHEISLDVIFATLFDGQDDSSNGEDSQKITFQCPSCHKKLHVLKNMLGKKAACSECKKILVQI